MGVKDLFVDKKSNIEKEDKKLNQLCLGRAALTNWEVLMIREGMIEKIASDISEYDLISKSSSKIKGINVFDKRFLLFAMVLFDKIDSSRLSMYDVSRLIDFGLIDEHALITEYRLGYNDDPFEQVDQKWKSDLQISYLNRIATEIMLKNKDKIINEIGKELHTSGQISFRPDVLREKYDEWVTDCELYRENFWGPNREQLGDFKQGIIVGLYQSIKNGSVYYDGAITSKNRLFNIPEINNYKKSEYISQIISLDLSPELYSFPIPDNMNEVIQLRKRPEIVSFRKVFFEWCGLLRNGDFDLACKVKQDIRKSQNELDKYYKWENSKVKLFSCLIDATIGQIPYISNIVSAVSPFSTRKMLEKRIDNSWILLLR